MFESGREWGFILVIAAAYFEGGELKIHEITACRNWLLSGSSGKKIRYLVEKFYWFASKYMLMTLLEAFSGYVTVSGGLNPARPCSLPDSGSRIRT